MNERRNEQLEFLKKEFESIALGFSEIEREYQVNSNKNSQDKLQAFRAYHRALEEYLGKLGALRTKVNSMTQQMVTKEHDAASGRISIPDPSDNGTALMRQISDLEIRMGIEKSKLAIYSSFHTDE